MSEFASGNVKEERRSSKVQTTIIDETLFKKFLKEKENDILKFEKPRNCNVRPRYLMGKTLDSDIQNLILKYGKKEYRKAERIFNDFIRKSEKINSVLAAHSFEVQVSKCLSSFAIGIDYFLSAVEKQTEFLVPLFNACLILFIMGSGTKFPSTHHELSFKIGELKSLSLSFSKDASSRSAALLKRNIFKDAIEGVF